MQRPRQALPGTGLTGEFDGSELLSGDRGVRLLTDGTGPPDAPTRGPRIGVSAGAEHPWRWWWRCDPNISVGPSRTTDLTRQGREGVCHDPRALSAPAEYGEGRRVAQDPGDLKIASSVLAFETLGAERGNRAATRRRGARQPARAQAVRLRSDRRRSCRARADRHRRPPRDRARPGGTDHRPRSIVFWYGAGNASASEIWSSGWCSTPSPGLGSRSGFTGCSRTGASRPSGPSRCCAQWPVRWPSRGRRSAGWPSIAGTTCSGTNPETPTPHTATAPVPSGRSRGSCGHMPDGCSSMDATDTGRFAPDLQRDPDFVVIDRIFPLLACFPGPPVLRRVVAVGNFARCAHALLWAGLVRMAVLHHVTWSVNSVCHLWGRRPFGTHDQSSNVAALALVSFGESWHNFHHASPSSARHGVLPHQVDVSARLISLFERAGWWVPGVRRCGACRWWPPR